MCHYQFIRKKLDLLIVSNNVEMILLSAKQIIEREFLGTIRYGRSVPISEFWFVVESVAVNRSFVFRIFGFQLDRHRVGGLRRQRDLWRVWSAVYNQFVSHLKMNLEQKLTL